MFVCLFRYVLISRSDIYPRLYTSRGITMMLIGIWVISFSLLLPPLTEVWGRLGFDEKTFSCTILRKNDKSPKKMLFLICFFLPCIVIIISYLCIYWKVRSSRRNLEAHTGQKTNNGFHKREDSRLTKLMLTIFLCFLLCFLPLSLVNIVDDQIRVPILHVIASILAWASAVINPFIYAGTNRLYRDAYRQVLCPLSSNKKIRIPNGNKPTCSHSSKISSPQNT